MSGTAEIFVCRIVVCVGSIRGRFGYSLGMCVGDTGGRVICSIHVLVCVW